MPDTPDSTHGPLARFQETRWSVVLQAGQSLSPQTAEALETLCRAYESADKEGQNLIRLVAELSADAAKK